MHIKLTPRELFHRLYVPGLAAMASLITVTSGIAVEASPPPEKPNMIFIFTDDQGWGDLGCYGHPDIKTPHLDSLAKGGKLFTNWYVNAPVCAPSRAAFMTGQTPQRHNIFHVFGTRAQMEKMGHPLYLDPENTITRVLQENGYKTAHYGKWHLSAFFDEEVPSVNDYGIDDYRCHAVARSGNSWENYGPAKELPRDVHHKMYTNQWTIDESIRFIEESKENPFFINVWIEDPHTAIFRTEEQMEPYSKFQMGGPKIGPSWKKRGFPMSTTPHQYYYSTITDIDSHVGRLIAKLKELNLFDDTIIIFSSDNGPETLKIPLGYHSGVGSPGVFRGGKRSLYEGGIRVPGIVSWPAGGVPAGVIDRASIVSIMDLYPTLLEAAAIPVPVGHELDGESMLRAFQQSHFARSRPLFWETSMTLQENTLEKRSPRLAMREGNWKFLMSTDGSRKELYDLDQDPGELDNLSTQYPQIVSSMAQRLLEWFHTTPVQTIKTKETISGWERVLGKQNTGSAAN